MDQHGSTWIKRLQHAPFSLSLQHVAAVLTHGSCVRRPDSWLMRQASHASGVRLMRQTHGSCVRRHASDSWLMRQASGVSRPMRQASGVSRPMRQASGVMRQASGVRRQTPRAPFSRPIQPIQPPPLSVMTTTKRRHFPMLLLLDLRPLRCMAWGNTTLLPHAIQRNGHE